MNFEQKQTFKSPEGILENKNLVSLFVDIYSLFCHTLEGQTDKYTCVRLKYKEPECSTMQVKQSIQYNQEKLGVRP